MTFKPGRRPNVALLTPLLIATGCLFYDCPDSYDGLVGEESVRVTVGAANESERRMFDGTTCGALGDLMPGSTFDAKTHFVGPGDACASHAWLLPTRLDTATSISERDVTFASGCHATWTASWEPAMQSKAAGGATTYLLRRELSASSGCPKSYCVDYFDASYIPL